MNRFIGMAIGISLWYLAGSFVFLDFGWWLITEVHIRFISLVFFGVLAGAGAGIGSEYENDG